MKFSPIEKEGGRIYRLNAGGPLNAGALLFWAEYRSLLLAGK